MPPVPGLIIVTILFFIFYFFLGSFCFAFLAGFVNGYLFYSFIHYGLFTMAHTTFGVSSQLWDYVFGTMPVKEERYGARTKD